MAGRNELRRKINEKHLLSSANEAEIARIRRKLNTTGVQEQFDSESAALIIALREKAMIDKVGLTTPNLRSTVISLLTTLSKKRGELRNKAADTAKDLNFKAGRSNAQRFISERPVNTYADALSAVDILFSNYGFSESVETAQWFLKKKRHLLPAVTPNELASGMIRAIAYQEDMYYILRENIQINDIMDHLPLEVILNAVGPHRAMEAIECSGKVVDELVAHGPEGIALLLRYFASNAPQMIFKLTHNKVPLILALALADTELFSGLVSKLHPEVLRQFAWGYLPSSRKKAFNPLTVLCKKNKESAAAWFRAMMQIDPEFAMSQKVDDVPVYIFIYGPETNRSIDNILLKHPILTLRKLKDTPYFAHTLDKCFDFMASLIVAAVKRGLSFEELKEVLNTEVRRGWRFIDMLASSMHMSQLIRPMLSRNVGRKEKKITLALPEDKNRSRPHRLLTRILTTRGYKTTGLYEQEAVLDFLYNTKLKHGDSLFVQLIRLNPSLANDIYESDDNHDRRCALFLNSDGEFDDIVSELIDNCESKSLTTRCHASSLIAKYNQSAQIVGKPKIYLEEECKYAEPDTAGQSKDSSPWGGSLLFSLCGSPCGDKTLTTRLREIPTSTPTEKGTARTLVG